MIVVDASAALAALFNAGPARDALAVEALHAPHLVDSEVASGVLRRVIAGDLAPSAGWALLDAWRRLGVRRYPVQPLLERIWALRDQLGAYDAGYVALAEALRCPLLTADSRLSRASALNCAVTLVPR